MIDSEWLKELKKINKEEFTYWNPQHYILYLDGYVMYQFIAQSLEVKVLDFTGLEQLVDERQDVLGQCKQYMKKTCWNIVKKWKNIF